MRPRTEPAESRIGTDHTSVFDDPQRWDSLIAHNQLRVTGKKGDALQEVIAKLGEGDYGIHLQFENVRN